MERSWARARRVRGGLALAAALAAGLVGCGSSDDDPAGGAAGTAGASGSAGAGAAGQGGGAGRGGGAGMSGSSGQSGSAGSGGPGGAPGVSGQGGAAGKSGSSGQGGAAGSAGPGGAAGAAGMSGSSGQGGQAGAGPGGQGGSGAAVKPVVVSEGDSISVFWGGNHTGIFAAAHPDLAFHGRAVGGSSISDPGGGNGLVQRRAADGALQPTHVTLLIGANDLAATYAYATPQDWLDALFAYVATWRSEGVKVAVATVLPNCVTAFPDSMKEHNARRAVVNPLLRQAVGTKIDAVIDYAADPVMGVDQAACDKALYGDGLHPTDGAAGGVGGQGKLAVIYAAAVEPFLGL